MNRPDDVPRLSDKQITDELVRIEGQWDRMILAGKINEAQSEFGVRFHSLLAEQKDRKLHSGPAVVRLRFLAGESSRDLDVACGEALGWRVSRDPWWNWHEGPIYDPPGDEWCIRKDGRNDVPCNEALPHFTAESFDQALSAIRTVSRRE